MFRDVSSAPDFSPDEQETHMTVYLKTFYELKRDENGRPLVNCSLNQKEKWETMHLYLRVLKRYYTLINLLTEAARVLKTSVHILTQNTPFKLYFDLELFTKYLFYKLVEEDFLIHPVVELAEIYVDKMTEENDEDKRRWIRTFREIDYLKNQLKDEKQLVMHYQTSFNQVVMSTGIIGMAEEEIGYINLKLLMH